MTHRVRSRIAIVVPCYDEEQRLPVGSFEAFAAAHEEVRFVLVNDGSRDQTGTVLRGMHERAPDRFEVIGQPQNLGKAEAVRVGMLRAFELGVELCGYWDADLAAPLEEIPRFAAILDQWPERLMVFGARVQLLGRSIERSAARHYLGRVFATTASMLLGLPVYDTQCGAKLFRATPEVRALFAQPFEVGWTFDVELIARLIRARRERGGPPVSELIYEAPLDSWHDVAGSKVSAMDFARGLSEIARIHRRYLRKGAPPLAPPER
ncbi:MAG: glycosyltransferase [Polyangiales bacterium]